MSKIKVNCMHKTEDSLKRLSVESRITVMVSVESGHFETSYKFILDNNHTFLLNANRSEVTYLGIMDKKGITTGKKVTEFNLINLTLFGVCILAAIIYEDSVKNEELLSGNTMQLEYI